MTEIVPLLLDALMIRLSVTCINHNTAYSWSKTKLKAFFVTRVW